MNDAVAHMLKDIVLLEPALAGGSLDITLANSVHHNLSSGEQVLLDVAISLTNPSGLLNRAVRGLDRHSFATVLVALITARP